MTSRLKRKLNDLGVDASSSKANESFCLIGTPLPPLEKSKDTGEFVPLWKQEVRDEKGRRRLHGAFTGGFSAGYFNTVGSKEGWTPQTFVSSRSDRAKQRTARPEDFMDEEDLAERESDRKLVDEADEMDLGLGGTQAELAKRAATEDDSMAAALAASLLPSPKDSVGARILKKMGWRVGQGIGPRLTRRQKIAQDKLFATAGDKLSEEDGEGEDDEAEKHTYAPRDAPLLLAPRKDNTHGLGYRTGMGLQESVSGTGRSDPNGPRLAAGFGLGALNEADEDDLDVYDGERRSRNVRVAYEAEEEGERVILGQRAPASSSRRSGPVPPQAPASYQTFRDGRPVLPGFELAAAPVAEDEWYPLPDVPKGWKPDPKRVWDSKWDKENMEAPKPLVPDGPRSHKDWMTGPSADERGALLGETPLPAAPKSVFDFMSQKDKNRLQNITTHTPTPATSATSATTDASASGPASLPLVERSIAQLALRGFQPFSSDLPKQARYTAFLTAHSRSEPVPLLPLPGQSHDQFAKELQDYAKSAMVFKPLSGAMAGRFTSAAVQDLGPNVQEGLHTPAFEPEKTETGEKKADGQGHDEQNAVERKDESPKAHAARMGMFGSMTRESKPWQPARLLCKRFGVKDPNPEPQESADAAAQASDLKEGAKSRWEAEDTLTEAKKAAAEGSAAYAIQAPGEAQQKDEQGSGSSGSGGRRDLAHVGLGVDDEQGKDTLTYERPSMDIFKAIFASDEEDSDDEDEEPEKEEEPTEEKAKTGTTNGSAEGAVKDSVAAPAHLSAASPTADTYAPGFVSGQHKPAKVDMTTFKPTFVPRAERDSAKRNEGGEKRKKKDKKEKKGKTLMSFEADADTDEGAERDALAAPKAKTKNERSTKKREKDGGGDEDKEARREKKKRKRDVVDEVRGTAVQGQGAEDGEEDMWVEKPPPEAVKSLVQEPVPRQDGQAGPRPPPGRKKAADFM